MEDVVAHAEFWRARRVFLTGHTGFKGSWLALWLQQWGALVTGYALVSPGDRGMFDVAQVAENMESHTGDIRDHAVLTAAIKAAEPEIIFHLAAQSLVRPSYRKPLETYSTNVLGTAGVLEAAREIPSVRAIVVVTSDKCYENQEWEWGYRENEPMGGFDPYSSSKAAPSW